MPRPRTYDSKFKLLIYALKQANPSWGHARITAELRERFGDETPSERTVSRFLQSISSGEKSRAELRAVWRAWDKNDDHEVREATSYLLSVVGAIQTLELFKSDDESGYHLFTPALWDPVVGADPREDASAHVPELTRLEAKWIARIHLAAPELAIHDTFWTAEDVVARVRVHELLDRREPFDYDDLHHLLAIKPWLSKERSDRYLQLVRAGQVPRYRITALRDLMYIEPPFPDSLLSRFQGDSRVRVTIPVPGDYSLVSIFVKRESPELELIRRRALNNDFELT